MLKTHFNNKAVFLAEIENETRKVRTRPIILSELCALFKSIDCFSGSECFRVSI